jgi:hypothetical protein
VTIGGSGPVIDAGFDAAFGAGFTVFGAERTVFGVDRALFGAALAVFGADLAACGLAAGFRAEVWRAAGEAFFVALLL